MRGVSILTLVANIKLTKPAKATELEGIIIGNMQAGKLQGKLTDKMLVELIEQLDAKKKASVEVEIKRKDLLDSDEEEMDLDAMFG